MTLPHVLVGVADKEQLQNFNTFPVNVFNPGDLGEFRMHMDPELAREQDLEDFQQATDELNSELLADGMLPWPGQTRVAFLDWKRRQVRVFFQEPAAAASFTPAVFIALAGLTLIAQMLNAIKLVALITGLITLLNSLPIISRFIPGTVASVADAVFLMTAIFLSIKWLRRFPGFGSIPIRFLAVGGGLIFIALRPSAAIEIFKTIGNVVGEIIDLPDILDFDYLKWVAAGALVIGGVLIFKGK